MNFCIAKTKLNLRDIDAFKAISSEKLFKYISVRVGVKAF